MCKPKTMWLVPLMLAALTVLAAGPGAAARMCDVDTVPAATLLLPYFEVDVSGTAPRGMDTAFAVVNMDPNPRIAHVTLWTEWAIPTVGFNVQLGGYDALSVNLIDLFTAGAPQGTLKCAGALPQRPGPLYFKLPLPYTGDPAKDLATLRKAHTGEAITTPIGKLVASMPHPGVAKGYITIDVVNKCTPLFPSNGSRYFQNGGAGVASNDNVLVGDYFLVDNATPMGAGEPMVHIRADRAFGDVATGPYYTFYGRYVGGDGSDNRQPLGSVYASRFWTTFPDNPAVSPRTELIVWRDTKRVAPEPVLVGARPKGFPIPMANFLYCNENEECSIYLDAAGMLPLATQRVDVDTAVSLPYGAGWMMLDLNYGGTGLFKNQAQGFVTTIFRANVAGGPMGTGFRAPRLATPCRP
ncbi:MAG TPA: hypothetical protein VFR03_21045 [Thermoanaerobaculia bacterium]|nr:hypothetical protein [Thermoanaerobaculia bacterium]